MANTPNRKWYRPTKAIITDAGFASRFLPWTKTNPKAMVPIGNKPIMQMVVEECAIAGIKDIIIVTTVEGKQIYEDYFSNAITHVRKQLLAQGKPERYETVQEVLDLPKIRVIVQDPSLPYGNGSPIVTAQKYIADDEAFVVCYSDDIVLRSSDVVTMLEAFDRHPDADGVIMAQEIQPNEVSKYGMIKTKGDKNEPTLDHIIEKPEIGKAPSLLASYGRYLLTPEIFKYLKPNATGKDGELWTVDGITEIAKHGNVYVETTEGQWRTTGDPENYFMALLENVLEQDDAFADEVRDFVKSH
ncbi:MAG: sugar phosphate nucleotidyltransferase [Candidatus Saccharibacteria bacterium]|nr:sugar phosphate nucleotidyltransferase [Candidatus Saccharibacteria bacterium]